MTSDVSGEVRNVAIGGVGGSGTRVVAAIVRELGYYIGDDLNTANDNLWFTLIFKRREVLQCGPEEFGVLFALFSERMRAPLPEAHVLRSRGLLEGFIGTPRPNHSTLWLEKRLDSFLEGRSTRLPRQPWGWKEPNTHLIIDRVLKLEPALGYIHVMRNGLDMSLSPNQNQLGLWGPLALGDRFESSPRGSLRYWVWAHRRMIELQRAMEERILLVDFDQLCVDPRSGVERIATFLGCEVQAARLDEIAGMIHRPATAGRRRNVDIGQFDGPDVDFFKAVCGEANG